MFISKPLRKWYSKTYKIGIVIQKIAIHSWIARIPVSSLHLKFKSYTLLSSLLKVTFLEEFCSNIVLISTNLSAAWNRTNLPAPIFCFVVEFLGMVVLKRVGFDFESLWIVGIACKCHSTGVNVFYHVLYLSIYLSIYIYIYIYIYIK